jgi:hypothetical protein
MDCVSQAVSEDAIQIEIVHGHADYTADELLEQAQANAQALILATVRFLLDGSAGVETWATALGNLFARAWGEAGPWEAGVLLDAMLTNYRALGARVISVHLASAVAEAVITGFPDSDLCTLFAVSADEAAGFHQVATVIAQQRDLTWSWQVNGDQTHFTVTRAR